jgi:acyl-CoA reductase-like NAD-dependent aldehyde dehydrogenase
MMAAAGTEANRKGVAMTATAPVSPQDFLSGDSFRMMIGDEFVGVADHAGGALETLDPSTGEALASVPEGDAADIDRAVAAAHSAAPGWFELGLAGRSECFAKLSRLLVENRERLAVLDALDSGNPLRAMRVDVDICHEYLRVYPLLAAGLHGRVMNASKGGLHYTGATPYGVVGRILAFNHPMMFAVSRPLPALITGHCVVMKPAPQTPLSCLALGELYAEAFPPGVMNIVTGGAAAGEALVRHPQVKRIAFTGSVRTGLAIQGAAAASGHVKNVSLELGGKNAMIVFPDVDVATAVEAAVFGMNLSVCQGQSCGSNSRVFVHDRLHDDFVQALAARLDEFRVALAYSEDTDMGPLVSAAHLERVSGYVQSGQAEGARLVTGGGRPSEAPAGGYFLRPTLFDRVAQSMTLAQEEIFGPVISVLRWSDYEAMIEQANAVEFGLTASVFTNDLTLAHRTADRLQAGYIWINDSTIHYVGTPFGGVKNSGIGREESEEELLSYLEQKVVHTKLGTPESAMTRHGW